MSLWEYAGIWPSQGRQAGRIRVRISEPSTAVRPCGRGCNHQSFRDEQAPKVDSERSSWKFLGCAGRCGAEDVR